MRQSVPYMPIENQRWDRAPMRCGAVIRAGRCLALRLAQLAKVNAVHRSAQSHAVTPPKFECKQKVAISENIKFAWPPRCRDLQGGASFHCEAFCIEPGFHDAAQEKIAAQCLPKAKERPSQAWDQMRRGAKP